jgi:hypothetical protein
MDGVCVGGGGLLIRLPKGVCVCACVCVCVACVCNVRVWDFERQDVCGGTLRTPI